MTDVTLSPRQWEVARLAAEGLSDRDIAGRLYLSPRTVQVHLQAIFARLDMNNRTQLARWVHQNDGLAAARAYAQWHLGDPNWADAIMDAARDPEGTWRRLAADGMEAAKARS